MPKARVAAMMSVKSRFLARNLKIGYRADKNSGSVD
jgi:hypothetical protein